ncbi:BAG family molecular chaperone regulator 7 [Camellia lanceoleosa]|uniref:BAG family molecular chaperone regulator 7 n=1 Tax=Camellia lanceoleosa TaxID=1840588 RepID=A0ACC0H0K5_9ERIC|nr:BAG family molecular chaperone regulator 7 [Camellia lanceoleosa]
MNRFRRFEIIDPHNLFLTQTSISTPKPFSFPLSFPSFPLEDDLDFALDLFFNPSPTPSLLDFRDFDTLTDHIHIDKTPFYTSTRRVVQHRFGSQSYLQSLCDRVSELELSFDRLVNSKAVHGGCGDRKYTLTAEIKDPDRKYKWTAEIKGVKKKKDKKEEKEKNYKWTAEIKDKGEDAPPITRTYTFRASSGDGGECSESEKKEKKEEEKKKKKGVAAAPIRLVEIEEPPNHGAFLLRQAFVKRPEAVERSKGKRKELSPQDAAMMIQMSFKAYLIRRSQSLRALRELAVAKAKLKEIRALFNNFSYRRRISRDAEECQRFSEKIIVLLLTVDGIEGADLMVRAAKRSMVDELEAMLDVVDPQPPGRSVSMRRRTFDMPDGLIQKELAAGVAEVVQMLDQESGTFDPSL